MSDTKKKLDENIPESVISTRQGGGGKSLSYLETWYVIDRLNQVLGQGNWAYSSEANCVHNGTTKTSTGETYTVHYLARVRLVCSVDGNNSEFTDYGYGDGTDRNNIGKAHELAVKEAVSDGLKRCAKNLGRSMGLALYDKTQEFVGISRGTDVQNTVPKKKEEIHKPNVSKSGSANATAQSTKPIIEAAFSALQAQGKVTAEVFKTKYLDGIGLSKHTEASLKDVLNKLKTDFKELGL